MFVFCVLCLQFILIKNIQNNFEIKELLMIFTVTLVSVGTLFLVTSGISSSQIAPAMGLYGTVRETL